MIYLDNTTQSQQVYIPRQVIQTATTREINNITSGDVINIVDEKLEPYYNSAETDTQIENAVAAESARCEETYAKIEDIPDVSDFVTSADVKTQIEDYHYITSGDLPDVSEFITSGQAQEQINQSLSGYATEQWVEDKHYLTEHQSLSGFASEEYVDNAVNGAIDYVDDQFSSYSQEFTGYLAEKQDITAMTAYYTSAETDTQIENAIAAEVERADSTYATPSDIPDVSDFITSGDLASYALSADVDTLVEDTIAAESARTEETYAKIEDVSSAVNEAVNELTLGLAYLGVVNDVSESNGTVTITKTGLVSGEITTGLTDSFNLPDVSNFVTSADVETQITDKNYITSATVKDVFINYDVTSGDSSIGSYIRYEKLGGGYKGRIFVRYINGEPIISGQPLTNLELPTSADVETQITNKNYVTSAQVETQITNKNYITSADAKTQIEAYNYVNSGDVEYQLETWFNNYDEYAHQVFAEKTEIPDVSNFVTSATVQTQIDGNLSAYTPTSNFATINGSGITSGGNIVIQGGGGGGNANIIELTQAEYDALTAYTEDALYVITDAEEVDLNDFATSADLATKVDKINVTANSGNMRFPNWNAQGIITGYTYQAYQASFTLNGNSRTIYSTTNTAMPNVYAPTTAGNSGQVVVSNGNGAPSWSSFKFWYGSQSDYDAITTKDPNCIYFVQ